MNILYITSSTTDYLADSLLHGLRTLLGSSVVDYPKCEVLYKKGDVNLASAAHGKGFTCYGLLDDISVDRYDIFGKVQRGYFNLVVFSSIHRQFGLYVQFFPWLIPGRTIIIDGEDDPAPYPYHGNYWRHAGLRFLPRAHTRFHYYKREWTSDTVRYRWFLTLPRWLSHLIPAPRSLMPISFSIPGEKIVATIPEKIKLFTKHIVDPEVSAQVPGSATGHLFDDEASYYADLQASRFGITTKRAGWDCIRHYELAANACVPCFRDLGLKPETCAPHGLNETNCITYHSYDDLMARIKKISNQEYTELQRNIVDWVRNHTTETCAKYLLDNLTI